ncbi:unnamed protein product [Musa hybrid cultivar]
MPSIRLVDAHLPKVGSKAPELVVNMVEATYGLARPKLAIILMQIILVVSTITAFGIGYSIGSFQMMRFTYAGGVVLTALITVPNWQFFNHHHLKWLDPSEAERHPMRQLNDASVAAPKKKATKIK